MLITTENFQQYNNVSVSYDTKTHLFVKSLRLNFSNMVNLWSDFRKKVICDFSSSLVSVPRPHVKTREGSGHQAYPDVSPRNVNCARPYT